MFELDEQLLNIINKALCPKSEERFQSTDELIKAINGEIKVGKPDQKRKVKEGETKESKRPKMTYCGD